MLHKWIVGVGGKMSDERIKMFWLESCGTGNTMSLEDWLNEVNPLDGEEE
jgi:hypothetical protein